MLPAYLSIALLGAAAASPERAFALRAEGDRHFSRRALPAPEYQCDRVEVAAALAAYQSALDLDPEAIGAEIGALRSLFFRGGFCGETKEAQKATFDAAKRRAEAAVSRLEGRVGRRLERGQVDAFRDTPGAAALFFWAAVAWGQWALDHKLAAAWHGTAGRVRTLGEAARALDPGYEQGSPDLVLGRLHVESPKLPLVTGFVSRQKGLEHLRQAFGRSPTNTVAQWFLALAILEHEPRQKDQAVRLLKACAAAEPRAAYRVEDRHYSRLAEERLRVMGEAPGPSPPLG